MSVDLDVITSDENNNILKACIPYANQPVQSILLLYSKIYELKHTMQIIQNKKDTLSACSLSDDDKTPINMLLSIREYCSDERRTMIDSILNGYRIMQFYNNYKEIFLQNENKISDPDIMNFIQSMLNNSTSDNPI